MKKTVTYLKDIILVQCVIFVVEKEPIINYLDGKIIVGQIIL